MEINGMNFTLGADPEIFVQEHGLFKSAHGLVPGTKEEPFRVEKGAVQVDGMALEFNIDPAENYEEFQDNLDHVQQQLKNMIGDIDFLEEASVTFPEVFLDIVPEENLELGCDPDFDAWTMQTNTSPDPTQLMRTVGGHVHAGGFGTGQIDDQALATGGRLARIMDETLGVYSILWDHDDRRREMYGKAGAFRPKSYGMEYRSLSNAWIFKPYLVKFVFDSTIEAIEKMFDQSYEPDPMVREIMNTSDRDHNFFKGNQKAENLLSILEA